MYFIKSSYILGNKFFWLYLNIFPSSVAILLVFLSLFFNVQKSLLLWMSTSILFLMISSIFNIHKFISSRTVINVLLYFLLDNLLWIGFLYFSMIPLKSIESNIEEPGLWCQKGMSSNSVFASSLPLSMEKCLSSLKLFSQISLPYQFFFLKYFWEGNITHTKCIKHTCIPCHHFYVTSSSFILHSSFSIPLSGIPGGLIWIA